jgi:hypothetical protein
VGVDTQKVTSKSLESSEVKDHNFLKAKVIFLSKKLLNLFRPTLGQSKAAVAF